MCVAGCVCGCVSKSGEGIGELGEGGGGQLAKQWWRSTWSHPTTVCCLVERGRRRVGADQLTRSDLCKRRALCNIERDRETSTDRRTIYFFHGRGWSGSRYWSGEGGGGGKHLLALRLSFHYGHQGSGQNFWESGKVVRENVFHYYFSTGARTCAPMFTQTCVRSLQPYMLRREQNPFAP